MSAALLARLDAAPARQGSRPWLDLTAIDARARATTLSPLHRECFKYTPIDTLLARDDACPCNVAPHAAAPVLLRRFSELTGLDQAALRELFADLPEPKRHIGGDLALEEAADGWLIDVPATPPAPIEIVRTAVSTDLIVVRVAAGTTVDLIERVLPDADLHTLLLIVAANGAVVRHHRGVVGARVWSLTAVRVAEHARYEATLLARAGGASSPMPGAAADAANNVAASRTRPKMICRLETHVALDGRGASASLSGASVVGHGADLELPIVVEHRAPDTRSEQRFHGIGAGKGRSIFNGRIHIHVGAERSDAWLSNRNLALDPAAEINTKPELEIYADDVRCAHGATVGQLDADAAFLLAARGIPPDAARNMLASAFLRAAMAGPLVDDPAFALTHALPDAAGQVSA